MRLSSKSPGDGGVAVCNAISETGRIDTVGVVPAMPPRTLPH
jgi:hypothetical protein